MDDEGEHRPRIVVVGPCAAGKTTLVGNLRSQGYNIKSCAQEHSFAPQLWKQFSKAEILVFLDADLPTIARRQNRSDWTQARLDAQRQRLSHARQHCDLYLHTDDLTREQVAVAVEAFLHTRGVEPQDVTCEETGD
jgi:guanylate kinase